MLPATKRPLLLNVKDSFSENAVIRAIHFSCMGRYGIAQN